MVEIFCLSLIIPFTLSALLPSDEADYYDNSWGKSDKDELTKQQLLLKRLREKGLDV